MPFCLHPNRVRKVLPYRSEGSSDLRSPTVTKSLTYSCACHLASDRGHDGEGRQDSLVALRCGMNKYWNGAPTEPASAIVPQTKEIARSYPEAFLWARARNDENFVA